ncbi:MULTISPECIES: hypothetical protein [Delftia]|uniref:hypothetical protein n=1 Tax=Delftia TaxID=80865 RepID=UPI001BAFB705|nr:MULTISPECIES: hypothetical protein [Delftia]MBS3721420.1 hypothetical protein [Delftia sp. PE138]MDR6729754.1 hypothetical protein [Delftia lacustris]
MIEFSLSHRMLAAAGLAALLTACASPTAPPASGPAQPAGGHGQSAFMGSYDANRDGVVTRQEYDTVRKQRFLAGDTNGDGWLSEKEYVDEFEARLKQQYAGRQPDERYAQSMKQAHVRFGIVDRNRDGKYTVEEDMAIADRSFKEADVNADGVVDKNDVKKP